MVEMLVTAIIRNFIEDPNIYIYIISKIIINTIKFK